MLMLTEVVLDEVAHDLLERQRRGYAMSAGNRAMEAAAGL